MSHLPVLDADGCFLGILAAHAVMDALAAGEPTDVRSLTSAVEPVSADAPIGDVLRRLDHGDGAVAVTAADGQLLGWIRHRDILVALAPEPVAAYSVDGQATNLPNLAAERTFRRPEDRGRRRTARAGRNPSVIAAALVRLP